MSKPNDSGMQLRIKSSIVSYIKKEAERLDMTFLDTLYLMVGYYKLMQSRERIVLDSVPEIAEAVKEFSSAISTSSVSQSKGKSTSDSENEWEEISDEELDDYK